MADRITDPSRSLATQPYRTTAAAQRIARRPALALFERITTDRRSPKRLHVRCTLPDEGERPIVLRLNESDAATIAHHARRFAREARAAEQGTPHPPTTQIRVYTRDGQPAELRPLTDVLSPSTIATLAAVERNGGRK